MNWAYVAGFFDGEGYAGVRWHGATKQSRFAMTLAQSGDIGLQVLSEIKEFLGLHGITAYVYSDKNCWPLTKKIVHRLQVASRGNVVAMLGNMMPFLRVKKSLSQDIIRYNKIFPAMAGGPKK